MYMVISAKSSFVPPYTICIWWSALSLRVCRPHYMYMVISANSSFVPPYSIIMYMVISANSSFVPQYIYVYIPLRVFCTTALWRHDGNSCIYLLKASQPHRVTSGLFSKFKSRTSWIQYKTCALHHRKIFKHNPSIANIIIFLTSPFRSRWLTTLGEQ